MRLEIPAYNHIKHSQEINLESSKICTLIGGNGAGKSTILESIFANRNEESSLMIAFSSGQNERYSEIYEKLKKKTFKTIQKIGNDFADITKYYFNSEWVPLLIFMATSLKNGRVRQYLESNKYILIESNVDKSSLLEFSFAIPSYYIETYQNALANEEHDPDYKSVRTTYIHKYVQKIAERFIKTDYDFDSPIKPQKITLKSEDVVSIFERNAGNIFTFLSLANYSKNPILDYKDAKLLFEKNLSFSQLSDGEYQLLSIYALIDLFDGANTVFLLDEVDSHLHHLNINNLWNTLNLIQGKVITTSHLSGTILKNDYASIKFVQDGKINEEATAREVFSHIQDLTKEDDYYLKLFSKVQYIALLDDEVDWEIFKELACKKIGEKAKCILSKVIPYKRHSSFNTSTEIFGCGKLKFIESFIKVNRQAELVTQHIFCICDRDELPLTQIADSLEVLIHNDHKSKLRHSSLKSHLLSWKRREIENYLLSKTMLIKVDKYERLKQELPQVNFDNLSNFDDSEDLRKYDSKALLHPLYKESGFDYSKLINLIDKIPSGEISEDIVLMYNFIKDKIERSN